MYMIVLLIYFLNILTAGSLTACLTSFFLTDLMTPPNGRMQIQTHTNSKQDLACASVSPVKCVDSYITLQDFHLHKEP